jgi:hypothetical protein
MFGDINQKAIERGIDIRPRNKAAFDKFINILFLKKFVPLPIRLKP